MKGESTIEGAAMKKVYLSLLLILCMSIMAGCGADFSEEVSSVHLESSAKMSATAEEASQSTTTDDTEEQDFLATLAGKIPYEGLSEKYIEDTVVGSYDRIEDSDDNIDLDLDQTAYYWESNDGEYDVLEAVCESGFIVKINKLYPEVYWVNEVPDFSADKDAYDKQLAEKEAESAAEEEQETMVWISGSGSCYHSKQSCSNMKNPVQVTLSKAESMNKRPCKKCY